MVQDADATFDGAFFIGYHGGAGDADAVLCHTYTPSVVYEVRVNGVVCSEATLNAGLLGYYGVPLLLITGDRTTVEGVRAQMPWVRGVVVKESIGTSPPLRSPPAAAQRAIYEGARAAVAEAAIRAGPTGSTRPSILEVDLVKTEQADLVATIPGFERTGRTVRPLRARQLSGGLQSVRRNLATGRPGVIPSRWLAFAVLLACCAASPHPSAATPPFRKGFVYLTGVAPTDR